MSKRLGAIAIVVSLTMSAWVNAAEPTDAELTAFGKAMSDAITRGDADAYAALWDDNAMADRILSNIDAPADLRKGFRSGLMQNGFSRTIATRIIKTAGKDGDFSFLGIRTEDGEKRPILRLGGDDGLNYHEMVVQRDAAGVLKAVDVYIYLIGDTMSAFQRRMYLQYVMKSKDAMPPVFVLLETMQKAIKAGDFAGALAAYDKADPAVRNEKVIQFTRLQAALQVGNNNAYETASAEYARLFKDDAAGSLVSLDPLFQAKRFAEYNAALDRLDKQVGGDPYLDFFRGRAADEQGDTANAKRLYESALRRDPKLFQPADLLLTAALTEKDHATVKKYLLHIERNRPSFRFGDLKNVDLFADFIASPQYAEWQSERPKEQK